MFRLFRCKFTKANLAVSPLGFPIEASLKTVSVRVAGLGGWGNSHFALDKLDTLLDVGLGLYLILLDEYGTDELVDLVVFGELAKFFGYLFIFS